MKELHDAIKTFGRGLGKDIVKVDMFLNHRLDTSLIFQMGQALAVEFRDERPTLVMTVEASGIALALATAHYLGDLPVVFAKKGQTVVQNDEMAQARVYSFTHKQENIIRVDKKYVPVGSRVLIVDDFLADGQAVHGMTELCEQLRAKVVGVGIAVEKGFQPGGMNLRAQGIHLKSLAVVTGIENGKILLADD